MQTMDVWQVQEAKNRFSEVLRRADTTPQIITYYGEPKYKVSVISLKKTMSSKDALKLLQLPKKYDDVEIYSRSNSPMRSIDFGD
jgi:prevent-host-death family protein